MEPTTEPYSAHILADSIAADGVRLTTMQVTFPRIVLAEFNTHRVFSRNAASSRAIPVKKRIKMVEENPFVPEAFGVNQRGMQAEKTLEGQYAELAKKDWLDAKDYAVAQARLLEAAGVHKQLANRLLEPFAWITVIVTATEWENFFALRCHEAAQPEIRRAAENMRAAMDRSTPQELNPGEWHLPLILGDERNLPVETLVKLSTARCARVSYLTHDGKRDPEKDLALYERLVSLGHMSPTEHPAVAGRWTGSSTILESNDGLEVVGFYGGRFVGNFHAPWIQHRKLIPGEDVFRG